MRIIIATLIAMLVSLPVFAGDDGLTGNWKFNILSQGDVVTLWLLTVEKGKDGKLTATADSYRGAPKAKVAEIETTGDLLTAKFLINVQGQQATFEFEAKLPKPGAKKVFGSLTQGGTTSPAFMEATSAKTLFDIERDLVVKTPTDPRAFTAILDLIDRAKENKIEAAEMQTWVDASLKGAEAYGPRMSLNHSTRLLTVLQKQKAYASVGVGAARKVAKLVDPKMPLDMQAQILGLAADVLRSGGEMAEAAQLAARVDKLETQAYAEYTTGGKALNFKTERGPVRNAKSKRVVLVELFTGAQCPPCVAADMAFDGLEKAYSHTEVVLLQYHMHIPAPEPMSNPDNDLRFDYYADAYPKKVRGTPSILFNGKLEASGGGGRDDAPEKFKEYCGVVNKMLEATATVKLSATAVRTGDKIAITAKVDDVDKPGAKVRLRVALVEDWVRFKGGNGLQFHHRVVRAMPGGVKGVAVTDKSIEHKVNIDLDDLRGSLNKYLNDDYPDGPRPMRLRSLSVVAFVQSDDSNDVLQAVNVPVRGE